MRRGAISLVAFTLVFTLATAPASARPEDADQHFRHGVELYKDGDFSAALVDFQRAYELDPRYQVLYNVGEAQFALQDYASALRTFQKYLYEGGNRIGPKRRKDVDRDLEKLRQRVAVITVQTSEPGAQIAVDDVNVGTTPLPEPILVSAGKRRITATLTGRAPVTQVVQLAGGDAPTVTLTIAGPEVRIVALERPSLAPPILAWSATGAVVTVAVVTGVMALGASSNLKADLAAFPGNPSQITSDHSKTQTLALVTDVFGGLAVAAAGAAIYLTVRSSQAPAPPARPSARIVFTPTGAALAGAF